MKFGGTSVGNSGSIRQVADLVNGMDTKIVVVSAMAGTTNQLVAVDNLLRHGETDKAENLLGEIENKYLQTADEFLEWGALRERYFGKARTVHHLRGW